MFGLTHTRWKKSAPGMLSPPTSRAVVRALICSDHGEVMKLAEKLTQQNGKVVCCLLKLWMDPLPQFCD